jgi:hypothetical protein
MGKSPASRKMQPHISGLLVVASESIRAPSCRRVRIAREPLSDAARSVRDYDRLSRIQSAWP